MANMWDPIATEESLRVNDCGHLGIDNLARIRARQDVWFKLEYLFPACKSLSYQIWLKRRSGEIRAVLEKTALGKLQYGPRNKEEWEQLAQICLETVLGRKIKKEWIYEYLTPAKIKELERPPENGE